MTNFFPELPDDARVWVYQSNRPFTADEADRINLQLAMFTQQWNSHSRKVTAGAVLVYNQFIILAADETAFTVSGCSIDSSVRFVKELQASFGVDLFNRLNMAYKTGEIINMANRTQFEQLVEAGTITPDTTVFNNLVATKHDLQTKWEVPARESWHNNLFFNAKV